MSINFNATTPELCRAKWKEIALWLLRRRHHLRVTGNSMLPLLRPGDLVLVDPLAYRARCPMAGEIVIARHPHQPALKLIKRVQSVLPDGSCFLLSENSPEGTDSRTFGAVSKAQILGKVTCRFRLG